MIIADWSPVGDHAQTMKNTDGYFDSYAELYDQLQPVLIENYERYHSLALDFVPGDEDSELRILDLGCGTGRFLESVLTRRPKSVASAIDFSQEMLDQAKNRSWSGSAEVNFIQGDLGHGLPADLGTFDLVFSFSAIHHLEPDAKKSLIQQVFDALVPGGQFFLIDAMFDQFSNSVFKTGRKREVHLRASRLESSGFPMEDYERFEQIKKEIAAGSPEKDRIGTVQEHAKWLKEVGFESVDHVWHQWFEHFFIAEKAAI